MGRYRRLSEPAGFGVRAIVAVLKPLLGVFTKPTWTGGENIPASGGCVVVFNHVTQADPATAAHMVWEHGRIPRFLAKESLFRVKVMGPLLRMAGQIPVHRGGAKAADAFRAAIDAVKAGECVVIFPEGSVTKDPDQWPMVAKTGAARVALLTGCPVIPAGQWGVHELLPAYGKPRLRLRRYPVRVSVGEPVDLADLIPAEGAPTPDAIRTANDRIMRAITAQVAIVRGLPAPARPFDPKAAGVAETGDPNRDRS